MNVIVLGGAQFGEGYINVRVTVLGGYSIWNKQYWEGYSIVRGTVL